MDTTTHKRRPKLVLAALRSIGRSKTAKDENPPGLHACDTRKPAASRDSGKKDKERKPLGNVWKAQGQRGGLGTPRPSGISSKFEVFQPKLGRSSNLEEAELKKEEVGSGKAKPFPRDSEDEAIKENPTKNKRKFDSKCETGTLKSILKQKRFRRGPRRSSGMPTRRNTEPALDKRISFQSQVIIRRYSQDLPATTYGKELHLALTEERVPRIAEWAPVYSHFMTEDDSELKFNDADNDSASDSEPFSPLVKPLSIFPSPKFKPKEIHKIVSENSVNQTPESVEAEAAVEEATPALNANHTDEYANMDIETRRSQACTLSDAQLSSISVCDLAPCSPQSLGSASSDTDVVESEDDNDDQDKSLSVSSRLEPNGGLRAECASSEELASPKSSGSVNLPRRLSFTATCTPSPADSPLQQLDTDSSEKPSFDTSTINSEKASSEPIAQSPSNTETVTPPETSGCCQTSGGHRSLPMKDTVRAGSKDLPAKPHRELRTSLSNEGSVTCSLQAYLDVSYCQTFVRVVPGGVHNTRKSMIAVPTCSLQSLCISDHSSK